MDSEPGSLRFGHHTSAKILLLAKYLVKGDLGVKAGCCYRLGGAGQGPEGHGEHGGARDEAILTDEGEVNGNGVLPACQSPDRLVFREPGGCEVSSAALDLS